MLWLKRLISKEEKRLENPEFREKLNMLMEVRQAHSEWIAAHRKLDWVLEKDQIDYAIYAMEAAEKRYEMLLRQAKALGWQDGITVISHAYGSVPRRTDSSSSRNNKVNAY